MALEVVKMRQGMSYSCKEKTIILNVFKYFRTVNPDKCVTEIVRRTAKATGCSEKSVFQFRKEEASGEGFKEPSKTKVRKNININSRFIKYDESVRQAIRNLIYDLKYRNIVPTLSTLLKNINANEKLPNFSVMTLRRLLRDMGFYYEKEKLGSKAVLVERIDRAQDLKKENLLSKRNQVQHNEVSHQLATHSNNANVIGNQPQKQMEMKPYSLPQPQNNVNVETSQMYMLNHGHRPFPVTMPHQENIGIDPRYMTSNMIPPQIHCVPPSMKPPDMSYMHATHPHSMVLQQ